MQSDDGSFGGVATRATWASPRWRASRSCPTGTCPVAGCTGRTSRKGIDFILKQHQRDGAHRRRHVARADVRARLRGALPGRGLRHDRGRGDTALGPRLHEAIVKAVRLIERRRTTRAGGGTTPCPHDADVSVTICQVMALRRRGTRASRSTSRDRPRRRVRATVPAPRRRLAVPAHLGRSSAWPRSAAGIASLNYAGIYEDAAIDSGLDVPRAQRHARRGRGGRSHYFYGHYYAVQAMYLAGRERVVRPGGPPSARNSSTPSRRTARGAITTPGRPTGRPWP